MKSWLKGGLWGLIIGLIIELWLSMGNGYFYFLELLIYILIGFIFGAIFGKIVGLEEQADWIKGLRIGLMIGIVLAVANIFVIGLLGSIITFFPKLLHLLLVGEGHIFVDCFGGVCWNVMVYGGSIGFIIEGSIIGILIGWIVGKISKN